MKQKIEPKPEKRRFAQPCLIAAGVLTTLVASPTALAQEETETSPIVQTLEVTASVQPSCAFWLDRDWMTLGVFEGDAITGQNTLNMRCSVLPSGLNNQDGNFAPACFDAGQHYQPQPNDQDPLSPRAMVLLGGDPMNENHRLNYNIFSSSEFNEADGPDYALGTGHDGSAPNLQADSPQCVDNSPNGNLHPGLQYGWGVGPGGPDDEVPNQTFTRDIVVYVYPEDEQPGTPVQGNYSDTVTVYFVFLESTAP